MLKHLSIAQSALQQVILKKILEVKEQFVIFKLFKNFHPSEP